MPPKPPNRLNLAGSNATIQNTLRPLGDPATRREKNMACRFSTGADGSALPLRYASARSAFAASVTVYRRAVQARIPARARRPPSLYGSA